MSLPRLEKATHISDRLNELASVVKTRTRSSLTDANRILETITARFFNALFGWDLVNLNAERACNPAVDLGDRKRRLAIQVTNEESSDKIKRTATIAAAHKQSTEFDRLIIFFLLSKKPAFPKSFTQSPDCPTIETWDISDLQNQMLEELFDLSALARAAHVLDEEMGRIVVQTIGNELEFKYQGKQLNELNNDIRVVEVFVGRDHDMAIVRNLLASHDRVAILGAPGVGKTTIAVQLAKEMQRSLFVPLTATNDSAAVIRSVAIRLNIALVEQDRAAEQISEAIINRDIDLLVLDGFEHVLSARSLITHWSRYTKVLVTTQVSVGVDEYTHELKPLTEDNAIELLTQRVRMRWADRRFTMNEQQLLRKLVNKLDRLPLSLELAAPLLADHEVGELISLLDRRFEILRIKLAPTDMPVRHHSLEATLAVSWDMLSEDQQAALSQCTVFSSSFDGKSVSSVIKLESTDSRQVVSSLVDRSLIARDISPNGKIEYSLLETIRAYCLERSGPVDADVHDRHAEHFLKCAIELYKTLYQVGSEALHAPALGSLRTLRGELAVIRNRTNEDSFSAALALLFEHELLRRDGPMQEWGDLSKEALHFMARHSGLPLDMILQLTMAGIDGIVDFDHAPELIGFLVLTNALSSQKGQLLAARWHRHLPRANDEPSRAAVDSMFSDFLNNLASKSASDKNESLTAEVNSALNELASESNNFWSLIESDDVLVAAEDIWNHPDAAAPILLELAEKVDPVGAIHLARSIAWATSESTPLGGDLSNGCKVAAALLRDVALGLCDRQAEFACPFGLLVSEMAHYLLCYSGRSDESEQTQAISLLTAVVAAAHDRGDKRVEGMVRLERLRLADWAERSGGAPVNDRMAEWAAIDRLILDTEHHYNIVLDRAYWFVRHEQWEQAKKELARISSTNTHLPFECIRALSDSALIELFLDRPYQAKSFLRKAKSVMENSRKTRVSGTGRDALGSFFGRFAVINALERKFSKAEKQLDQMNRCIGADGIACIYRVCVRGLEAKAGVQNISFGKFGDNIISAPPGQGVGVAIELLKIMETFAPQAREIDCLSIRIALKLLQPI